MRTMPQKYQAYPTGPTDNTNGVFEKSLYGNTARVVNPWGLQQIRVRWLSDDAIITTSTAAEVSFATAANTVYSLIGG
jgi:alpha-L-fucosidase 2